jgi:hypothetical protein
LRAIPNVDVGVDVDVVLGGDGDTAAINSTQIWHNKAHYFTK